MKNKLKLFVFGVAVIFYGMGAQAALQPLIELEADESPGELYHLGVQVNDSNKVTDFYFQDVDKEVFTYNLKDLKKGLAILKRDKFDIIIMQTEYNESTQTADVTFTYMVNAISKKVRTVTVAVRYNPATTHHEFVNKETGKPISSAMIETNYLFRKAVGVRNIDFQ